MRRYANALTQITDSVKTITERIELFQKNVKTEKGKELIQKYIDARTKYREELVKAIAFLKDGKQKEAGQVLKRLAPLREPYLNSMADIIKYQDELMTLTSKKADDNYAMARVLIIVAILRSTFTDGILGDHNYQEHNETT